MSQENDVLQFPAGLVGFPELKRFRLYEAPSGYPLKFLQSLDEEEVAYVCVDVVAAKLGCTIPLEDSRLAPLALKRPEDAQVLAMVVVPRNPRQMTANLANPLVINKTSSTGCQIELPPDLFPPQYPVFSHQEDVIISFPRGLIGFPELRSFRLMEPSGGYPLKFLQAVGQQDISFTCVDVAAYKPDYEFPLSEEDASCLSLETPEDAMVLAMVVVPEDPRQMTANLAGPLVLNIKTRMGRQVVLSTDKYPLRFPLFPGPR